MNTKDKNAYSRSGLAAQKRTIMTRLQAAKSKNINNENSIINPNANNLKKNLAPKPKSNTFKQNNNSNLISEKLQTITYKNTEIFKHTINNPTIHTKNDSNPIKVTQPTVIISNSRNSTISLKTNKKIPKENSRRNSLNNTESNIETKHNLKDNTNNEQTLTENITQTIQVNKKHENKKPLSTVVGGRVKKNKKNNTFLTNPVLKDTLKTLSSTSQQLTNPNINCHITTNFDDTSNQHNDSNLLYENETLCTENISINSKQDISDHEYVKSIQNLKILENDTKLLDIASQDYIENNIDTVNTCPSYSASTLVNEDGVKLINNECSHTKQIENPKINDSKNELNCNETKTSILVDMTEKNLEKIERAAFFQEFDADDFNDPIMVGEYTSDIISYLIQIEKKTMPDPQYMKIHSEFNWKTRQNLVEFLVNVHYDLVLLPETLFLSVNLIDRFLSRKSNISIKKLNLVALTATVISCKYEEYSTPVFQEMLTFLGKECQCTINDMARAERYMLNFIGYDMSYPCPLGFLRRLSKADNYNSKNRTIAKYLLEISLIDYRFNIQFPPSLIAASAMYLTRIISKSGGWTRELVYCSGYGEKELMDCTTLFFEYLSSPSIPSQLIYTKYSYSNSFHASIVCHEWARNYKAP
ncbi:hypothetical protein BB559_002956 [Furculomyces boomerangus]|uniref:Uncharacterized protein n=1 Tax=Furculomyces boomerangus TaxID=61424 RepID=A0A2T9YQP0_9FUNG|nr:hypothetical protein BB559_002956 [Furculomyces boomerangus]